MIPIVDLAHESCSAMKLVENIPCIDGKLQEIDKLLYGEVDMHLQ